MINSRFIAVLLLLFLSLAYIFADQPPMALIIWDEGVDYRLILPDGSIIDVDPSLYTRVGEELFPGTSILTGDNTIVELQILPENNILRLAENTTFTLKRDAETNQSQLLLDFGRLRAKVAKVNDQEDFVLRTPSAVAGVRGTDFGLDMVIGETGLRESIYVFEGEVEVTRKSNQEQKVIISANEIVNVPFGNNELVSEVMPQEIREYWKDQEFAGKTVDGQAIFSNYDELIIVKAAGSEQGEEIAEAENPEQSEADQVFVPPTERPQDIAQAETEEEKPEVEEPPARDLPDMDLAAENGQGGSSLFPGLFTAGIAAELLAVGAGAFSAYYLDGNTQTITNYTALGLAGTGLILIGVSFFF
jgi:hypothetical protein